jgi:hypothetical protein
MTQFTWGEQVTDQDRAATSEEEESDQLHDLATSILGEYKAAASLSDLDTAISLFRGALDRRPTPHPLRSDSLNDLAGALVTRFSLTNQRQDLDQAIQMCDEVLMAIEEQFQLGVRVRSVFRL